MSESKNGGAHTRALPRPHSRHRGFGVFRKIGPGLVTGAADDDPSGIGTYSQVGAAYGSGSCGRLCFATPLRWRFRRLPPASPWLLRGGFRRSSGSGTTEQCCSEPSPSWSSLTLSTSLQI